MQVIKLGYFKKFGTKQVKQIKNKMEQCFPEFKIQLIPENQENVKEDIDEQRVDISITDVRDDDYSNYYVEQLAKSSLVILFQRGNFPLGKQTVKISELDRIPDILIAETEEEAGELHYQRDLLQIKSSFLAVDSFNEASLMAESGSGYFLMNELTAPLIESSQLQKMFLLDNNGQQLAQTYSLVYAQSNDKVSRNILDQIKMFFT